MHRFCRLALLAAALLLLAGAGLAGTPSARADAPACARTNSASTPSAPTPGHPCWTDVMPYPFGFDGNPVDPNSAACDGSTQYGPNWGGEFFPSAYGPNSGNPPCYLQVNSLAFRAWNRGLAAAGQPKQTNNLAAGVSFGVWLYNGSHWFPDPTFPGSGVCPGSKILWAGKLDYWLIGSTSPTDTPQRILCRFDGVNLQWEPLSLPAATVARLSTNLDGKPVGGVTSGACYAWNDCWFFGDDGIQVHWDGQALADATPGLATSPWLQGDFTGAAVGTDPSGHAFAVAVTKSSRRVGGGAGSPGSPAPLPSAPDKSPPSQLFGSQGGPPAPLSYSPPAVTNQSDPFTTDLAAVSADSQGDVWVAGDPAPDPRVPFGTRAPAPLQRLTEAGASASCPGYGPNTFTSFTPATPGYQWSGLSTFPDGSALASAQYHGTVPWQIGNTSAQDLEPAIVQAVCGQLPGATEFRIPDPRNADQAHAALVPTDMGGQATAVAANASNDAWTATTDGLWQGSDTAGNPFGGDLRPHLYRWTDGQPPAAPAGDDKEQRPSLFTLDPPVYQVGSPTIITTPGQVNKKTKKGKGKRVTQKPAIYALQSHLKRLQNGTFTLYLTFKVRRAVTIGLQALHGQRVVASSGLRRFTGHTGQLAVTLDRNHWPTRVRLVTPKK